jgi:hypothetical protein
MKSFTHRVALPALAAIAVSTNSATQAQQHEPEQDRWYNVELIIFSQTSAAAATSEVWESLPDLTYPKSYHLLTYAESEAASEDPLSVSDPTKLTPITQSVSAEEVLDPNQVQTLPMNLLPTPFVRLAQETWEFAQRAGRMRQSGRYEILFHESWNQPIVSSERTLPILLDQSGYLQEWPKLQGSIKLHLARYLHLETNFWINTMGNYLPGDWQMPPPPLGPVPVPDAALDELFEEKLSGNGAEAEEVELDESELPFSFQPEEPVEVSPTYPWRHAVLLQQTRKMRSTEVHYIDHPMMGVIVLVTPITEEELEAIAIEELEAIAIAIEEFGLDPNQPL